MLQQLIDTDEKSADFLISLFSAALFSYKHDSVLKPYPLSFVNSEDEKDVYELKRIIQCLPSVRSIDNAEDKLDDPSKQLISWILTKGSFSLSSINPSQFASIQKTIGDTSDYPTPNFVFELRSNEAEQEKFEELRNGRKLFMAYHGSRLENFHSIIHNGLASHMNKVSVFGEGTYLSSELSVSIIYSPTGLGWERSSLGHKLGCVAVCEVIDDPSVKCQVKSDKSGSSPSADVRNRRRSVATNSEAGDVPEKYYVVTNNEMIRVKYLLVYSAKTKPHRNAASGFHSTWMYQYRFSLMIVFYITILLAIGLSNSQMFQIYIKKFFKTK